MSSNNTLRHYLENELEPEFAKNIGQFSFLRRKLQEEFIEPETENPVETVINKFMYFALSQSEKSILCKLTEVLDNDLLFALIILVHNRLTNISEKQKKELVDIARSNLPNEIEEIIVSSRTLDQTFEFIIPEIQSLLINCFLLTDINEILVLLLEQTNNLENVSFLSFLLANIYYKRYKQGYYDEQCFIFNSDSLFLSYVDSCAKSYNEKTVEYNYELSSAFQAEELVDLHEDVFACFVTLNETIETVEENSFILSYDLLKQIQYICEGKMIVREKKIVIDNFDNEIFKK